MFLFVGIVVAWISRYNIFVEIFAFDGADNERLALGYKRMRATSELNVTVFDIFWVVGPAYLRLKIRAIVGSALQ